MSGGPERLRPVPQSGCSCFSKLVGFLRATFSHAVLIAPSRKGKEHVGMHPTCSTPDSHGASAPTAPPAVPTVAVPFT